MVETLVGKLAVGQMRQSAAPQPFPLKLVPGRMPAGMCAIDYRVLYRRTAESEGDERLLVEDRAVVIVEHVLDEDLPVRLVGDRGIMNLRAKVSANILQHIPEVAEIFP
jgi:hypothetical protein